MLNLLSDREYFSDTRFWLEFVAISVQNTSSSVNRSRKKPSLWIHGKREDNYVESNILGVPPDWPAVGYERVSFGVYFD